MAEGMEAIADLDPAPTPQTEPDIEPAPEAETSPEPEVIDEGKPGGADPQAVRARREYQARRRAEADAEAVRTENIRLAERLRVIEEERSRAAAQPAQRIYTIAELNAAVDAGQIQRADADRYVEEIIIPRRIAQVTEEREAKIAEKIPVVKAIAEINEYRQHLPFLNDRNHPEFQKVAKQYFELVNQGLPKNEVTEALAVKLTHGNLDTYRKKAELAAANANPRTMPSDAGGGNGATRSSAKVDVSRAPDMMRHIWESTGTPQADREAEYRAYAEGERRRQAK